MKNTITEEWWTDILCKLYLKTKLSGIKLPEVHGRKKTLDSNSLPEIQRTAPQVKSNPKMKPRLGQGRVGIKCKKPHIAKRIDAITDKLQGILKIPASHNIVKIEWTFQCMNNQ